MLEDFDRAIGCGSQLIRGGRPQRPGGGQFQPLVFRHGQRFGFAVYNRIDLQLFHMIGSWILTEGRIVHRGAEDPIVNQTGEGCCYIQTAEPSTASYVAC